MNGVIKYRSCATCTPAADPSLYLDVKTVNVPPLRDNTGPETFEITISGIDRGGTLMKKKTGPIAVFLAVCMLMASLALAFDRNDPDRGESVAAVSEFLAHPDDPADLQTLSRAISVLGEVGDERDKAVLADVLTRDTPVSLAPGSRLPGAMSPLDTLRAAAIIALRKLDGREYLDRIKEVYRTAADSTLRGIAKENIEALGGTVDEAPSIGDRPLRSSRSHPLWCSQAPAI